MSERRLGIISYLPPRRIYPTDSFLQNMKDYPSKNKLIMFSDEDYGAGVTKLQGSVEVAKTPTNKMGVNNLIFYIAMRIAASNLITHVMLLENDCRVNCKHWDEVIFNEFFRKNPEAIAGGSLAIFNPCAYSRKAAERYERFVIDTAPTRPMPLSMTGSSNLAEKRDCCVFPNGAFAIYNVAWILKNFPEIIGNVDQYIKLAQQTKTWDYEIGIRLWNEHKENVYDKLVHIDSIYSGYGNVMSSEQERQELLDLRKVVGVHQIKTDWNPSQEKRVEEPFTKVQGNTEIFICTYIKDFPYLKFCLQSISKFCKGFSGVTIMVPEPDVVMLKELISLFYYGDMPVTVRTGYEWKNKGMLWHMAQECAADKHCPLADFVAHFDADCIFNAPVTPETFFRGGKPMLRYEPFESLAKRHPGTWNWKTAAENALPFSVANEGMRGHPEVYCRATYEKTRQLVKEKHDTTFNEYVRTCQNKYPQTFAEYPTLSAVAIECYADSYHLVDCSKTPNPDKSPWPVIQFWSHGDTDKPQEITIDGVKQLVVPAELAQSILKG